MPNQLLTKKRKINPDFLIQARQMKSDKEVGLLIVVDSRDRPVSYALGKDHKNFATNLLAIEQ